MRTIDHHIQEVADRVIGQLSARRFEHTLGVAEEAARLARIHEQDESNAYLAGLLHDIARELSLDELKALAEKFELKVEPEEITKAILHARVGSELSRREWPWIPVDVIKAVEVHTLGAPGMSPLDMIIYLADKVEPRTRTYAGVEKLRSLAEESLPAATIACLKQAIKLVQGKGQRVHTQTVETVQWLENKYFSKEGDKII